MKVTEAVVLKWPENQCANYSIYDIYGALIKINFLDSYRVFMNWILLFCQFLTSTGNRLSTLICHHREESRVDHVTLTCWVSSLLTSWFYWWNCSGCKLWSPLAFNSWAWRLLNDFLSTTICGLCRFDWKQPNWQLCSSRQTQAWIELVSIIVNPQLPFLWGVDWIATHVWMLW